MRQVRFPQHFKDPHVPDFLLGFNLTLTPLQWRSNESAITLDTCQLGYSLNGTAMDVVCSTDGTYRVVDEELGADVVACMPVLCPEYVSCVFVCFVWVLFVASM